MRTKRLPKRLDSDVIAEAIQILHRQLRENGVGLSSPMTVRNYLMLNLANLEHEVFTCLFLDVKNRLIAAEELFRGSLTSASVYPREVVKTALKYNAASVLLAHNHPSGSKEPSTADHSLTRVLKDSLKMVDVRVLDHFIVAGKDIYSFAENGHL